MKKKYDFCLSVTLILTAFLLAMSGVRRNEEALAARIAPEILRFHVLANSDSAKDQALKLEVKDLLLEEIRRGVLESLTESAEYAASESSLKGSAAADDFLTVDRETIAAYVTAHGSALEYAAEAYMAQRGFDYQAKVCLETCEFPQKTYGDMTFPAGTYDAVRVILGNGEGQNFWCVLYPSLCYLNSTYAVVPDSSKETLKALIPEDDFQELLTARHLSWAKNEKPEQNSHLPRFTIRFKLAEFLNHIH